MTNKSTQNKAWVRARWTTYCNGWDTRMEGRLEISNPQTLPTSAKSGKMDMTIAKNIYTR